MKRKWMGQREYKRRKGVCPRCGSADILGDAVDIVGNRAEQEVGCQECCAEWIDVYRFERYYIIREGNK